MPLSWHQVDRTQHLSLIPESGTACQRPSGKCELLIAPGRNTNWSLSAFCSERGETYEANHRCYLVRPGCGCALRDRGLLWPSTEVLGGFAGVDLAESGCDGLCHRRVRAETALGLERHHHGSGGRLHLLLLSFFVPRGWGDAAGPF